MSQASARKIEPEKKVLISSEVIKSRFRSIGNSSNFHLIESQVDRLWIKSKTLTQEMLIFCILVIDIILALKALWSCAPYLVRKFRSFVLNSGLRPSPTSISWVPKGAPWAPGSFWVRFNLICLTSIYFFGLLVSIKLNQPAPDKDFHFEPLFDFQEKLDGVKNLFQDFSAHLEISRFKKKDH